MIAVFGWFLFGIASAAVAVSKNRGFFSWLFLGFLLGPIALVMVGFMPRLADPSPRTRRCPHCAEYVMPEALVCKHCGRDLPPLDESELAKLPKPTPRNTFKKVLLGLFLLWIGSAIVSFAVGTFLKPDRPPAAPAATKTPPVNKDPWKKVSTLDVNGRTIYTNTKLEDVQLVVPKESMASQGKKPDPNIPGHEVEELLFTADNGTKVRLIVGRWTEKIGTLYVRAIYVPR